MFPQSESSPTSLSWRFIKKELLNRNLLGRPLIKLTFTSPILLSYGSVIWNPCEGCSTDPLYSPRQINQSPVILFSQAQIAGVDNLPSTTKFSYSCYLLESKIPMLQWHFVKGHYCRSPIPHANMIQSFISVSSQTSSNLTTVSNNTRSMILDKLSRGTASYLLPYFWAPTSPRISLRDCAECPVLTWRWSLFSTARIVFSLSACGMPVAGVSARRIPLMGESLTFALMVIWVFRRRSAISLE